MPATVTKPGIRIFTGQKSLRVARGGHDRVNREIGKIGACVLFEHMVDIRIRFHAENTPRCPSRQGQREGGVEPVCAPISRQKSPGSTSVR